MHNKLLQNMLGVDIEKYKKISDRYKIVEKNGKGKEYILNTNILIFEVEYLNGKRNGKGKEYNEYGNLKFEGKYKYEIKKNIGKIKFYLMHNNKKYFII